VPVVGLASAASRSDGKWTALALLEDQLYLVDFGGKSVAPFPGITKTEVPHPITLIGIGDTIIVGDWGLRRFTEWSPTGQRVAAWPVPDSLQGAVPKARDAAGQWYFELWPDAKPDGSGLIDSGAVVRADPQLSHFDTLARLAPPELVKVSGVDGMHYQRRSMGGNDAWGVLPDGTLWVARVFQNRIDNVQCSWVKLGVAGSRQLLSGGVNDLGGTLMNESISRAAGTEHGQEFSPEQMEAVIGAARRTPEQRTTLYQPVTAERRAASFNAAALADLVMTPFSKVAAGAHAVARG